MINGPNWSSTLQASLAGKGFTGSKLMDFTDAVGNGGQTQVVGKSFTTTDAGFVPNTGVSPGTGTGITSLVAATISTLIFSLATTGFGQSGARLMDVTDSIGDAAVSELALAQLTSTHTPVFGGVGTIDVGSISVVPGTWGTDIEAAAPSFIGSGWPTFADAIGQGQGNHVLAVGSGSVVIAGAFGGPPPPAPVPGVGVGSGVVA